MLMQILEDVLPFLGGLGVLLVGFASGLSVLLNGNGGDFGEPHLAFVSVLNYGLFSEFGKGLPDQFDPTVVSWVRVRVRVRVRARVRVSLFIS